MQAVITSVLNEASFLAEPLPKTTYPTILTLRAADFNATWCWEQQQVEQQHRKRQLSAEPSVQESVEPPLLCLLL